MYLSCSSIFCLWTICVLVFGTGVVHICFVCFCPVSCLPNVASVSEVSIRDCLFSFPFSSFVLCLVCPLLPISLMCPLLISSSVFSLMYCSYVLCAQCSQCLWSVHSWLPLRFSLTFLFVLCFVCSMLPVSLECPFLIAPFVLSNSFFFVFCFVYSMLPVSLGCPLLMVFSLVYLSCVLCAQCYRCLWRIHSWLLLRFSLTFIYQCLWIVHSWLPFPVL